MSLMISRVSIILISILILAVNYQWRLEPFVSVLNLKFDPAHSNPSKHLPIPWSDPEAIFWFVHVSDIHLSILNSQQERNFKRLLDAVSAIEPLFVAATGDLTDARRGRYKTGQEEEEWKTYKSLLQQFGMYRKEFWFDLRGNHDCFNVASSQENYYLLYSVQKRAKYTQTFHLPYGQYRLTAIDGCPEPGPSAPMNFFGSMCKEDFDGVDESSLDRHSFLLGHYPMTTLTLGQEMHFNRLSSFSLYLCGHLHNLIFGLGEALYANHKFGREETGILELEVGDLKQHKLFRIVAIDHDLISFRDLTLDEFEREPIVIITNPKDARFWTLNEPTMHLSASNEIRILVLGKVSVRTIQVFINDRQIGVANPSGRSNIWTCAWDPLEYSHGLHTVSLTVNYGTDGQTTKIKQYFSINGERAPIGTFGEKFAKFPVVAFVGWSFVYLFYGTGLMLLGIMIIRQLVPRSPRHMYSKLKASVAERSERASVSKRVYQFVLLFACGCMEPSVNAYYPLVTVVYLTCLRFIPWFLGPLIPSSRAISFLYIEGIQHNNGFIKSFDPWLLCFWVLCIIFVPSLFLIILTSPKPQAILQTNQTRLLIHRYIWVWIIVWILASMFVIVHVGLFYGGLAVLASPGISWLFAWQAYNIYSNVRTWRCHNLETVS